MDTSKGKEKRKPLREVTPKQLSVYQFIFCFAAERGHQPSIKEIAQAFGYRSQNSVFGHLDALKKKGWTQHEGRFLRNLTLLKKPNGEKFHGFSY